MKKQITTYSFFAFSVALCFLVIGCNSSVKEVDKKEAVTKTMETITNPLFTIAPVEYSELTEKSAQLLSKFDYDAWAEMLADDVTYSFPDGDQNTRTKLVGKKAVLDWWKNWQKTSGVQSMTMSEFNHIPINITGNPKGGAQTGIIVSSYFTNTMVINNITVPLRMNFAVHFNDAKKIDSYITYYDRVSIIKAMGGKNVLETVKAK